MKSQTFSVGELASLSGLTIRTLQYYDRINLLPASSRTENGRRSYTRQDMIKLEQIMLYKSLGFPLHQIQEKLVNISDLQEIDKILSEQSTTIFKKMEAFHSISAVIEACREVIQLEKNPPWAFLVTFINKLNESDLTAWSSYDFTDEQRLIFGEDFHHVDEIMGFYHRWKTLLIKAAAYNAVGIHPSEPVAQSLARQWIDMAKAATGGKEQHLNAYLQVNQARENWPKGIRSLMEAADSFVSDCCKIYCLKNEKGMFSKLFDKDIVKYKGAE